MPDLGQPQTHEQLAAAFRAREEAPARLAALEAREAVAYEALTAIKEALASQVCEAFEVCEHRACDATMRAWELADMAWTRLWCGQDTPAPPRPGGEG